MIAENNAEIEIQSSLNEKDFSKAQGHWILAQMGKKILRPGGKRMTNALLNMLQIGPAHKVVEFAPGLGYTARRILKQEPRYYYGIEKDPAAVDLLRSKIKGTNIQFKEANAAHSELEAGSIDKVYAEAMLTMQADHRKAEIIAEAFRILKPGGQYAIQEMGLDCNEKLKAEIQRELAKEIKVNARPLTREEWIQLLQEQGFRVKEITKSPMHLLEPARMIDDEGLFGALSIVWRILNNPAAKKRILGMRRVFRAYKKNIYAIGFLAEKP